MPAYLHTPFAEIDDAPFQQMVEELYHCVGWSRDDAALRTPFYLFSAIAVQAVDSLTKQHLPLPGVLQTKIERLPPGPVSELARELAGALHRPMESLDGKRLLSLIKAYTKSLRPASPRPTAPPESDHERMTQIILQRRANGDL